MTDPAEKELGCAVPIIIFLVLSIALDFLAELGYKGPFCICLCNCT